MYRKEVNERSPMRVFENSMHGGLGRGNVGVVASRHGVGKTPLLVQIALDDLMRDRRVLHISHEHAVDHVRAYYSEIFHDLCTVTKLADPEAVRLDVERHRLILSLMTQGGIKPPIAKVLEAVAFARDVAHFEPDVVIIDGFDFASDTLALESLGALARDLRVELWLSAHTPPTAPQPPLVPFPVAGVAKWVNVVVYLQPEGDVVRLRLLKDHENADLADLHLRLDPHTLRVIDEDVRPSERPPNPRRFRLISGGGKGAEAAFGACAERWGVAEVNFTFQGHRLLERGRGTVVLDDKELKKGDFSLLYVSKRLNRVLSEIPLVRNVLQTIWHQINHASQVFVVGAVQDDNTVRGGTGWGAELARLWKKPLFVFDQKKGAWLKWSGTAWQLAGQPSIGSESFAGIGTQHLTEEGRRAIEDLFRRSFGDPSNN
jgi:hypothetical protein